MTSNILISNRAKVIFILIKRSSLEYKILNAIYYLYVTPSNVHQ